MYLEADGEAALTDALSSDEVVLAAADQMFVRTLLEEWCGSIGGAVSLDLSTKKPVF